MIFFDVIRRLVISRRPWISRDDALNIAKQVIGPDDWPDAKHIKISHGLIFYDIGVNYNKKGPFTVIVINAYSGRIYLHYVWVRR